jgi:CheY-like chemotaxis protein
VTRARRRGRVLIVDDDRMIVDVMSRFLSRDHDTMSFTRADEALAALARGERFDVILCDLMMPVMTGVDLYEAVARDVPEQASRMVFLTGGAFTTRARAFLDRVSNACLEKPFDLKALLSLVNERVK